MGSDASKQSDSRVRRHLVSYKQFVRDLIHCNHIWSPAAHAAARPPLSTAIRSTPLTASRCCVGCVSSHSFSDSRTGCVIWFEALTNLDHHALRKPPLPHGRAAAAP